MSFNSSHIETFHLVRSNVGFLSQNAIKMLTEPRFESNLSIFFVRAETKNLVPNSETLGQTRREVENLVPVTV